MIRDRARASPPTPLRSARLRDTSHLRG
ncbi:hypothetical protein THAOC_10566, partial [Thalassiosira oceanica]